MGCGVRRIVGSRLSAKQSPRFSLSRLSKVPMEAARKQLHASPLPLAFIAPLPSHPPPLCLHVIVSCVFLTTAVRCLHSPCLCLLTTDGAADKPGHQLQLPLRPPALGVLLPPPATPVSKPQCTGWPAARLQPAGTSGAPELGAHRLARGALKDGVISRYGWCLCWCWSVHAGAPRVHH